jgi:hypothetical protein
MWMHINRYQYISTRRYHHTSATICWRWPSCSSKGVRTMWKICESAIPPHPPTPHHKKEKRKVNPAITANISDQQIPIHVNKYKCISTSKCHHTSATNIWRSPSCSSKGVRTIWKLCEKHMKSPPTLSFKRWHGLAGPLAGWAGWAGGACWAGAVDQHTIETIENETFWINNGIWYHCINGNRYISTDDIRISRYAKILIWTNMDVYEQIALNIITYQQIHSIMNNMNTCQQISIHIK